MWLPPVPPRAVLFLFDGQNVFSSTPLTWRADETTARLIEGRQIESLAIVGIETVGAARASDLLPYPNPRDPSARLFKANVMADFVVRSLLPMITKLEPELASVRHIGIGGASYGAIGAIHTVHRHPGVFDRLLVESAPLWVGDGRLIEDAAAAHALPPRIHIGVGTRESKRSPEVSAELVRLTRRYARALRARSAVRLRIGIGARHHETMWAERLPDALRWLFPAERR